MLLSNVNPFFIGFEDTVRRLNSMQEAMSKQVTGYPPYNICKTNNTDYIIEFAVAGFSEKDIDIELEENVLKIKGKLETTDDLVEGGINKTYFYKGIADRAFTRQFTLADDVEVKEAKLINGMLKIYLEHIIPEYKKPKRITIK